MTVARTTFASLLLAALALAQAGRPHPGAAERYLPLRLGSTWRWRVTEARPETATTTHEELAWDAGQPMGAASHTWLCTCSDGGIQRLLWTTDTSSITGAIPTGDEPRRVVVVPTPIGIEVSWPWFNRSELNDTTPPARTLHRQGELVAMSESVQVPAGRFDAVHVRIASWRADEAVAVDDLWFAAGTGPVKTVRTWSNNVTTRELLAYTPAVAPAVDIEAALRRQLPTSDRSPGKPPAIQWLAPDESLGFVRGHFAAVTFGDGKEPADRAAWFVDDTGRACAIGDGDLAFWRERWHELLAGPPVRAGAAGATRDYDSQAVVALSGMLSRVGMHRAGVAGDGPRGVSTSSSRNPATRSLSCEARLSFTGKDCTGAEVQFAAVARIEGDELVKVHSDTTPKR